MAATASCCRVCLLTYVRHHLQCLCVGIVKESQDSLRNLIKSQWFANCFSSAVVCLPLHSCWFLIRNEFGGNAQLFFSLRERAQILAQAHSCNILSPLSYHMGYRGITDVRATRRIQTPLRLRVAGAGVGGVVESCVTRWLISRIDPRTAAELSCRHRQPAGNSPRPENYCSSLQETTRDFFANYLYFGTYSEEFQGVRSLRSEFMSSEKVCEDSSP